MFGYISLFKPPKFWFLKYLKCLIFGHKPVTYGSSSCHYIIECEYCGYFISED